MSRRTVHECDRGYRHEIHAGDKVAIVTVKTQGDSKTYELCSSCARQVERVLSGENVEEPP